MPGCVAPWLEPHLVHQQAPSRGVYGRQLVDVSLSYQCFSLSPSLSPPLSPPFSLPKINKHILRRGLKSNNKT